MRRKMIKNFVGVETDGVVDDECSELTCCGFGIGVE